MRRPRREFTVFSLAAIDLFCSAMGAFMVISIVLLPYFGKANSSPLSAENRVRDQQQIESLQSELTKLKDEIVKNTTLALFGIVTHAKSAVLVVDLSGSIYNKQNDPKAKNYIPVVQRVCDTIIDGLKADQKLQIIGFHSIDGVSADLPVWKSAAAPLGTSRAEAKAFVKQILAGVSGGTPTRAALHKALAEDVDAVFLVTDGAPNEGQRQGEALCNEITTDIAALNHGRKEIHCIAVGEYNAEPYCVEFLMRLARENHGQFIGQTNF